MPGEGSSYVRSPRADRLLEDGKPVPRGRSNGVDCPHCGSPTRSRSTRLVTSTLREIYLQCTNLHCGASFGAQFAITHQIAPSARPNPEVRLRKSPLAMRRRATAPPGGSEVPLAAND